MYKKNRAIERIEKNENIKISGKVKWKTQLKTKNVIARRIIFI